MKKNRFDKVALATLAALLVVSQPSQTAAQALAQEQDAKADATTIEITEIPAGHSITITSETPITIARSGNGKQNDLEAIQNCQIKKAAATNSHFGRNGPLTAREFEMAKTAWAYFVKHTQTETGLANAVGAYPSTTLG